MRTFDAAIAAELAKEVLTCFFMLELQLATTWRFNDTEVDIYDDSGNKFSPVSFSFGEITGSAQLAVESIDIEIDDTNQVISGILLGEDVRNKVAKLYIGVVMPAKASQYPPAQNTTYVKATSHYSSSFEAHFATDPAQDLTGLSEGHSWISATGVDTNQRLHIDLGSAKIITRIYYENMLYWAPPNDYTIQGVKNFTLWGSNSPTAFDDLVYGNDAGWTPIETNITAFERHAAVNASDPKYIYVTNTAAYRYYAFKFADNYGTQLTDHWMGLRRIELQSDTGTEIKTQEFLRGLVGGWELFDDNKAKITITNEIVLWNKKCLRIQSSSCPWVFKGTECAYAGAGTWCDQSYDRCQSLGNNYSFGGNRFLPSIIEKEIWWGRTQKL